MTTGGWPEGYHPAVSVATSPSRGPSPYQACIVSWLHGVGSSANPASRVGRRCPWRRGIRAGGIEPQARDPTDTGQPRHLVEPCQGRTTAGRHQDDRAARPPAPHEPDDLPGAFQHGVRAAAALCSAALGGTPHRQTGPGPDPVGPCYGGQQQTTEPAPATDFDTMSMRGPHGLTVEALRWHLLAASACDGVIQATDADT